MSRKRKRELGDKQEVSGSTYLYLRASAASVIEAGRFLGQRPTEVLEKTWRHKTVSLPQLTCLCWHTASTPNGWESHSKVPRSLTCEGSKFPCVSKGNPQSTASCIACGYTTSSPKVSSEQQNCNLLYL